MAAREYARVAFQRRVAAEAEREDLDAIVLESLRRLRGPESQSVQCTRPLDVLRSVHKNAHSLHTAGLP